MINFIKILFKAIFFLIILGILYGLYYVIVNLALPLGIVGYILIGLGFIILAFPLFAIFKFLFGMVMS